MTLAILTEDLICMNALAEDNCFRVELAYARDDNLLFGERIYREDAKLWLYKDLADIVCLAARKCYEAHRMRFVLYDGLRTTDAQKAMMLTRRAQDNPQWLEEPRMLSLPGAGGHPRGMAVDIGLEDESGNLLDMGCPFDFMDETAHREYGHSPEVKRNRLILDGAMIRAAENLGIELTLLPEEWWDFRLPKRFYQEYAPLSENDLPEDMRLMPPACL